MGFNREDPKQVVAAGYDRVAKPYNEWVSGVRVEERAKYTEVLLGHLQQGAAVLELGCGIGLPTTRRLAERVSVTGVDISEKSIEMAKQNVPDADFIQSDMTRLSFEPERFDAVTGFYSIIHVPREEHPKLIQDIATWLKPGGFFVASLGANNSEAYYSDDWFGAPMFWSHFDADTYRSLVKDAGLTIVSAKEETAEEFGRPITFLWMVAQNPA